MFKNDQKTEVIKLRHQGRTREEINKLLSLEISKSTFSYWTRNLPLSSRAKQTLALRRIRNLKHAQKAARIQKLKQSEEKRALARTCNLPLLTVIEIPETAKIALALLYYAEGTKSGNVTFGNSDPEVIAFFLKLFRKCYQVDETKFRCTLQCRADQHIQNLEMFWCKVTQIPLTQFYGARIDPRSIGKPSTKPDYRGVCRVDYFDSSIFTDLLETGKLLLVGKSLGR